MGKKRVIKQTEEEVLREREELESKIQKVQKFKKPFPKLMKAFFIFLPAITTQF